MSWFSRRAAALLAVLLLAAGSAPAAPALAQGEPPLGGFFADNFILLNPPVPAPQRAFSDLSGQALTLADYRGKLVLVNVWATWCAPCVREMPSLDRLQAELGPDGLVVLALSMDRGGARVVEPFLARHDLENLEVGLDPKGELARALGVRALPSSYLVAPDGRVVGAMEGPAEWDGADAKALIRHYLSGAKPAPAGGGVIKTRG